MEWGNIDPGYIVHERGAVADEKLFPDFDGENEDIKTFHPRFKDYKRENWAELIETLISRPVDPSCHDRDIVGLFKIFYQVFCYPYTGEYDVIDRVKALYPNITTMMEQRSRLQTTFMTINMELERRKLVNPSEKMGREIKYMRSQIAFAMKTTFQSVVMTRMLQKSSDMASRSMLEEMAPDVFFQEEDVSGLKRHQQLLDFYYQNAFKKNLRKEGTGLYKPRYNEDGDFVQSYDYDMEIEEFVFSCLYPISENGYWYQSLTERPGNASLCVNMLTKLKSEWLKDLERNRYILSWKNGIYNMAKNTFYFHKKLPGRRYVGDLTGLLIAIRYHDEIFHEDEMHAEMNAQSPVSFASIQMGPITRILVTQGFTPIEQIFILGMLGRLLFPIGAFDNWGLFLYFLGLGGTGKSSLLRLLAACLDPRDVGYLNNALQKTFALEGIAGKLLFLALDIDNQFQLDQATFNSAVVGEEVVITQKFHKPKVVKWFSHGAAGANTLPGFASNGGAFDRRIFLVMFGNFVKKSDPKLFESCLQMKDRFIKVICSAYHALVALYGHRNLKDVMPDSFKDAERRSMLTMNPLVNYVSEYLVPDESKFVLESEFKRYFKLFLSGHSIYKHPTVDDMMINSVISKMGAKIIIPKRNGVGDPLGQTTKYIKGLQFIDAIGELEQNK